MLSYNDWYQWKWAEGGSKPAHLLDAWEFHPKIDTIDRTLNFKEAVRDALRKLEAIGLPLYLMYSGGLDSEIILYEALQMNLRVIPVAIRFDNDLNKHDIKYVEDFAIEHGVEVLYLDVDVEKWFIDDTEFGYRGLVTEYGFVHYATPLNFWARKKLEEIVGDCVCITGSGDLPLAKLPCPTDIANNAWYVCVAIDSQYKRLDWYAENYPSDAPLFFMYTPELVYSFITEKEIAECTNLIYKLSVSSSKKALYRRHWPELKLREKFTGFEFADLSVNESLRVLKHNPLTVYTNIKYENFVKLFGC